MSDQSESEKIADETARSCGHHLASASITFAFHACQDCIAKALHQAKQETALTWFQTPNPLLGNVSPIDMIRSGRGEKLCKWIDQAISEGIR